MPGDDVIRLANRGMAAFDLVLGTATIAAPDATLRVLGHDRPSDDARELFRRCGPIWLTFAAAHLVGTCFGYVESRYLAVCAPHGRRSEI